MWTVDKVNTLTTRCNSGTIIKMDYKNRFFLLSFHKFFFFFFDQCHNLKKKKYNGEKKQKNTKQSNWGTN